MKVESAAYVTSGVREEHYPSAGLPEIALVGRSNVGKSSLINTLLTRRNLARTSGNPGKTRTANFYLVNEKFFFVDLPGYGYAKISQGERKSWQKMMSAYLTNRRELQLVIQLIDFRHPPTALDQEMYATLTKLDIPMLVVANKTDKVNRSQWVSHRQQIFAGLPGLAPDQLVLFSTETKQGKDDVWHNISAVLANLSGGTN